MSGPVEVAVIPVAGLGTRWLPVAVSTAKELIPVWKQSASAYVVAEALASGAREIVFVTSPTKLGVPQHFQRDERFQRLLEKTGKRKLLDDLERLWEQVEVRIAVQDRPLGLGHAILCAQSAVGQRPFAVMLPDELLFAPQPPTKTLIDTGAKASILLMEVPHEHTQRYGIAALADPTAKQSQVTGFVEKPAPEEAPSRLAAIGRYVLPPAIFEVLATQEPGKGGEIQLTDALARYAKDGELIGVRFDGVRHDVGQPLGHLMASLELALSDPEDGEKVRATLEATLEAYRNKQNNPLKMF